MTELAPAIYPKWARWTSPDALTHYRRGLDLERKGKEAGTSGDRSGASQYNEEAYRSYVQARQLDRSNMLAQLRIANCLEVRAGTLRDRHLQFETRVEALRCYAAIRLREPTIFEAGYRASLLLSVIADQASTYDARLVRIVEDLEAGLPRTVAPRDPTHTARDAWNQPLQESLSLLQRCANSTRELSQRVLVFLGVRAEKKSQKELNAELSARLRSVARHESQLARSRLRPLWTLFHERRFRHRYELQGQPRRQLRKALGISRMCLRARQARQAPRQPSDVTQLCWRGWVFWRYICFRWAVAGWGAHYNAACFYALLPQTDQRGVPFGGARIRRRALKHLERAIDEADGALTLGYVRVEDPDLEVLRRERKEFFHATRKLTIEH